MPVYNLGDRTPSIADGAWVAPDANIIGAVELKAGASVWFGATLRGDNEPIVIGENSNIQDASILHTDEGIPLVVGAQVTVGHHVMLHGCTIGEGSLIGIGAVILNGAVIGKGCLVGAGALVTENKVFPDDVLILGSPARVARALTPEQAAGLRLSAAHYVANARRYAQDLRSV
jgi:carbonic anhydrase/acetyltransferase-like protein (isoleucine patch superfamily)